MITNDEKREFISKIYDFIPEGNVNLIAENKIIESKILDMLIADSDGAKLYKYREINKYSLKNLKEGTLYCASPSSFNDPFDCKIGLDISSFFRSRYMDMLLECIEWFNKYIDVSKDIDSVHLYTGKERKVFDYWSKSACIQLYLRGEINPPEELENEFLWLMKNMNFVIEMLKGFMFYEKYAIQTAELVKVFESNTKYTGHEVSEVITGDYKQILTNMTAKEGIMVDADEISMITLLHQSQSPDDISKAKKVDIDLEKISRDLAKDIDKQFRVGCLSTTCKNHLMWSHYAAGHKGFCIEYDFSKGLDTKVPYMILPVIYSKERVKFPWRVALAENPEDSVIKLEAAYCKIFTLLSKDSVWEYENEWRIILPCDAGTVNAKMSPISCIYIGAFCKEKDEKKLVKIARKLNIPIKKMVIDRGDYSLHVQEI